MARLHSVLRRSALLALATGVMAGLAPAQSRWTTARDAASGLQWTRPRGFEEATLPPAEKEILGVYTKTSKPADRRLSRFVMLRTIFVVFVADCPQLGDEEQAERDRWAVSAIIARQNPGCSAFAVPNKSGEYEIRQQVFPMPGYVLTRPSGNRLLGVYGIAPKAEFGRLKSSLRRMLKSIKEKPVSAEQSRIERLYRGKKLRGVPYRIGVRQKLLKDQRAIDTENYIIVHHRTSARLARKMATRIETIRSFYVERFPAPQPIEAVSIVRLCRTLGEYWKYGAPIGTGGYWDHVNGELVLFDYWQTEKEDRLRDVGLAGRNLTKEDTWVVLFHEAFHQYIHHAAGRAPPHDWFNEGVAEYCSGVVLDGPGRKVQEVGPAPWRRLVAHYQCTNGHGFIPLRDLLHADRRTFYDREKAKFYYSAAWSFVYFLRESPVAREHPRWSRILQDYYDALNLQSGNEAGSGGLDGPASPLPGESREAPRTRALAKVLEGLDLAALEQAWKDFVAAIP